MAEKEMLEIINSHREGMLQSDIRKVMGIDSKKCSRTVNKLMKQHLIRREDELADGRKTFRLFPIGFAGPSEKHLKLLAGGSFSPCTGCDLECYPETCPLLNTWVYAIIEEES
ncbi:MAG: helix-turn-helix domain-containing protein [ANME-2 cluster archaeon]|nr:helix-turn-helix domain-containing protein [ANME-2 cluster archaeon]